MAEAIRDGYAWKRSRRTSPVTATPLWSCWSFNAYDIAVLDRDIPGPSGDEIAERIVASGSGMPILMLTAADRLDDKATGFELGADDYLTKPFELRARAPSQSARPQARPPQATRVRDRRPASGSVPPRGLPRRPLCRADLEAVRSARSPSRRRRRCRQRRRALAQA